MPKNARVVLCCALTLAAPLFATQAEPEKYNCTVPIFRDGQRVLTTRPLIVYRLSDYKSVGKVEEFNSAEKFPQEAEETSVGEEYVVSLQDVTDASTGAQESIAKVEQFWKSIYWSNGKSSLESFFKQIRRLIEDNESELSGENTDEDGNLYLVPVASKDPKGCIKLTSQQLNLFKNPTWFERLLVLNEVDYVDGYKIHFAVADYLKSGALQGEMAALAQQLSTELLRAPCYVIESIQPSEAGDDEPQAKLRKDETGISLEFKNLTDFWGNKVNITLQKLAKPTDTLKYVPKWFRR